MKIESSKYKFFSDFLNTRKHVGYDFRGNILYRSLDKNLINRNDKIIGFIGKLENALQEMIRMMRTLKLSRNYIVDKNDEYLN